MSLTKSAEKRLRKIARSKLGWAPTDPRPISIIPGGHMPPKKLGHRWHYTTKSGIPIRHPLAYAKKGWSCMVYHGTTSRAVVGELYGSTQ